MRPTSSLAWRSVSDATAGSTSALIAEAKPARRTRPAAGEVSGFAPPGDIHRVHNTSDTTAISIHIYGTDVTRIGSSVRRYYD